MVESLIGAGVDRAKIDRARRRGTAYQCLRCHYKDGSKTINIRCRTEDHIMRVHLGRDEVPFACKLCSFRCMKRDQLLTHVSAYSKHVLLAAKCKVIDHSPFLWENPKPHVFGPLDYKAFSPEASLLHFLGILEEEQTTANTGPLQAEMTVTETRPVESIVSSSVSAETASVVTSSPVQSVLPIATPQQELPVLSHSEVSQMLNHVPSSGIPSPVLPGMSQAGIASQLTALLHSIAGMSPALSSSFGASTLCPPMQCTMPIIQSTTTKERVRSRNQDQDLPAELRTPDLRATVEAQGPSAVVEEPTDVGRLDGEAKADSDLEEEGEDMNSPAYRPTAIQRSDKDRESPVPSIRDEDVLQITDDDMTLSTPTKRVMEEDDQEVKAKKHKGDSTPRLPVNVADLSERTLVKVVESAQKVAERSMAASEQMTKAMVDVTCMLGKLTDAATRLRHTIEEHDREERRREERRRELDQRREDEWRKEWNRRRDEERRLEERRRDGERRDRQERRKEDRKVEEQYGKEKENETRPRSVLGRIYSKNSITEGNRKN